MDEMKMLLEAAVDIGPNAAGPIYAWIAMQVFNTVVKIGGIVAAAWVVMHHASKLFKADSRLCSLRDIMGVGSSGPMIDSEYSGMVNWVKARRDG